jgi:hypothetical protein
VKPTGTLVLQQAPGQTGKSVLCARGIDLVSVTVIDEAGPDLANEEREQETSEHPLGYLEDLFQARRAEDLHGFLSAHEAQRFEEARQTEIVIAVKMGDEDTVDARKAQRAHQLPLRALAAIHEEALPPTNH